MDRSAASSRQDRDGGGVKTVGVSFSTYDHDISKMTIVSHVHVPMWRTELSPALHAFGKVRREARNLAHEVFAVSLGRLGAR